MIEPAHQSQAIVNALLASGSICVQISLKKALPDEISESILCLREEILKCFATAADWRASWCALTEGEQMAAKNTLNWNTVEASLTNSLPMSPDLQSQLRTFREETRNNKPTKGWRRVIGRPKYGDTLPLLHSIFELVSDIKADLERIMIIYHKPVSILTNGERYIPTETPNLNTIPESSPPDLINPDRSTPTKSPELGTKPESSASLLTNDDRTTEADPTHMGRCPSPDTPHRFEKCIPIRRRLLHTERHVTLGEAPFIPPPSTTWESITRSL